MRTTHHRGDLVVANVASDTQGLVPGGLYRVIDVEVEAMPFGAFTTYTVEQVSDEGLVMGPERKVRNGHLLLASQNSHTGIALRLGAKEREEQ